MRRLILLLAISAGLRADSAAPLVSAVDSVGLTVSDLDRSVQFYSQVLSFEKVWERELEGEQIEHLQGVFGAHVRVARLQLGDEYIELTEYLTPRGRPAPAASRSNDRWFQHIAIIVSDMDAAYRRLRQFKVQHVSTSPQRLPDWNPNAGGIRAFYFRDPDGHPLEILQFPAGKGQQKWHRETDRLFLGIDHTAIAISDTETSLRFYRDTLGLTVAGESENYGPEQERLNNVFGARVRITALRAATGPGIEFLEYLAPQDGLPYPADERPNDLIHWETRFVGPSAAQAAQTLRSVRSVFISSGVVTVPGPKTKPHSSFITRDPDGHAVEIAEQ